MNTQITLLKDGKNAFDEIIKSINEAKEEILINMFIWRDDHIGNEVLDAVINALLRGVKVTIDKDKSSEFLEKGEETKQSMFHKKHTVFGLIKAYFVGISQNKPKPKGYRQQRNFKLEAIMSHKNLTLKTRKNKYDHSKFYLIDHHVLFLGGINIEDKEVTHDLAKMVYHDYMIKITDRSIITLFKERFYGNKSRTSSVYDFILNHKKMKEIRPSFYELIDNAKEEIIITMAYMGHKKTIEKLKAANQRGVSVSILTSNEANLQDHINKKMLAYLFKHKKDNLSIYLSSKMIHTKLLIADNQVTLGSSNMNRTAYQKLDELNFYTTDQQIRDQLIKDRHFELTYSKEVLSLDDLIYSKFKAFIESLIV